MVSERFTPEQDDVFDRMDRRGDVNAAMIRAAVTGESIGSTPAPRAPKKPRANGGRKNFKSSTEVQPIESEVDPHWQRKVDYLTPEEAERNSRRIAEIRAQHSR